MKKQFNQLLSGLSQKGLGVVLLVGMLPALLIGYAGYAFLVEPLLIGNADKKTVVERTEAEAQKGRAVELSEGAFRAEFSKVVGLFQETVERLPKEGELAAIMDTLQMTADRNNVRLSAVAATKDASKSVNADKLYEREIPCTVVGEYDDVMRYFTQVSEVTRIVVIRDYEIKAVAAKQRSARAVEAKFTLVAFHAPPTKEYPAIPQQLGIAPPHRAALDGGMK